MKNKIVLLSLIAFILYIFRNWFFLQSLSTGDWNYRFPQVILEFAVYPYAWNIGFGNGFGGDAVFLLALSTYYRLTAVFLSDAFRIPWEVIEKIIWYWPFLIVSVAGAFFLFKKLIVKDSVLALVASLIFATNTYVLMITGGGQMGVAMGYAMSPLVFFSFLSILTAGKSKKNGYKVGLLAGIVFSLQLLFDLRLAYVSVVFVGIYYLIHLFFHKLVESFRKTFIPLVLVPFFVTLFLHFFWILPFVLLGKNPLTELGDTFSGSAMVDFLSFAKFENTISLLHPNWPENLFGKVYFMQPEFLLFPVLAFSHIFFLRNEKKEKKIIVLFLSLTVLLGAFLAKGTSDPFGVIYAVAFEKIPGFMMFRDSTKWYVMVAMSYSLLIPYLIHKISQILIIQKKIPSVKYIFVAVFILFWGITISKAFTGELKGTFVSKNGSEDYFKLASFVGSQNDFFRTMWVPGLHQYSYNSNRHPAILAADYYSEYDFKTIIGKIAKDVDNLSKASVRYIVVPNDTEGKIFLDDRKYSEAVYAQNVLALSQISSIREIRRFGKVVVFEIPNSKDHFWSPNSNLKIDFKYVNPTKYEVAVRDAKKGDVLVFSENYNKYWSAKNISTKDTIINKRYYLSERLSSNSFVLPQNGNYSFDVYYYPQDWVNIGVVVSGVSLIVVLAILFWLYNMNKYK